MNSICSVFPLKVIQHQFSTYIIIRVGCGGTGGSDCGSNSRVRRTQDEDTTTAAIKVATVTRKFKRSEEKNKSIENRSQRQQRPRRVDDYRLPLLLDKSQKPTQLRARV